MTNRGIALALAAVGMTSTLTACGPEQAGMVSVGRDVAGAMFVRVDVCHGSIDGATIDRSSDEAEIAKWEFEYDDSIQVVSLAADDLPRDGVLVAYGWTTDNSWTALGPDFEYGDISELEPGTALTPDPTQDEPQVVGVGTIRELACADR